MTSLILCWALIWVTFLYFLVRELFACPITWLERLLFFFRKLCHENFEFPCLIISFILVALTFSLKHIVVCTFTLQEHCFVWINIADVYQKARCLPKSKRTFTLHVYCLFNSMHLKPTVLEWNRNWARIDRLWRAFLIPRNYFLLWQGITCYGKYTLLLRGDINHWTEIYDAVFHETPKLQGDNFIWCWLLSGSHWMANHRDDFGGIWLHCTLQWVLANTGSFSAAYTHSWLDFPTAIHQIVLWPVPRQKGACVTPYARKVQGCFLTKPYFSSVSCCKKYCPRKDQISRFLFTMWQYKMCSPSLVWALLVGYLSLSLSPLPNFCQLGV